MTPTPPRNIRHVRSMRRIPVRSWWNEREGSPTHLPSHTVSFLRPQDGNLGRVQWTRCDKNAEFRLSDKPEIRATGRMLSAQAQLGLGHPPAVRGETPLSDNPASPE